MWRDVKVMWRNIGAIFIIMHDIVCETGGGRLWGSNVGRVCYITYISPYHLHHTLTTTPISCHITFISHHTIYINMMSCTSHAYNAHHIASLWDHITSISQGYLTVHNVLKSKWLSAHDIWRCTEWIKWQHTLHIFSFSSCVQWVIFPALSIHYSSCGYGYAPCLYMYALWMRYDNDDSSWPNISTHNHFRTSKI